MNESYPLLLTIIEIIVTTLILIYGLQKFNDYEKWKESKRQI